MAQGDFTKEEADETVVAIDEMYKALSRPKQRLFFGHLNDILLFIETAKKNAPEEVSDSTKKG